MATSGAVMRVGAVSESESITVEVGPRAAARNDPRVKINDITIIGITNVAAIVETETEIRTERKANDAVAIVARVVATNATETNANTTTNTTAITVNDRITAPTRVAHRKERPQRLRHRPLSSKSTKSRAGSTKATKTVLQVDFGLPLVYA